MSEPIISTAFCRFCGGTIVSNSDVSHWEHEGPYGLNFALHNAEPRESSIMVEPPDPDTKATSFEEPKSDVPTVQKECTCHMGMPPCSFCTDTRFCENCGEKATCTDPEGVPLCDKCASLPSDEDPSKTPPPEAMHGAADGQGGSDFEAAIHEGSMSNLAAGKVLVSSKQDQKSDYDLSIHWNPDARAWAHFFIETLKRKAVKSFGPGVTIEQFTWVAGAFATDEDAMIGWFANAMMAMHDHLQRRESPSAEPKADAVRVRVEPPDRAELVPLSGWIWFGCVCATILLAVIILVLANR